mgnify:CR=1 FL=1
MKKKRGLIAGTAAVAGVLAYATQPLWAQGREDEAAGFRARLGLQQSFGYGDNLNLGVPGSPTDWSPASARAGQAAVINNRPQTIAIVRCMTGLLGHGPVDTGFDHRPSQNSPIAPTAPPTIIMTTVPPQTTVKIPPMMMPTQA